MDTLEQKPVVRINMLGGFSISIDNHSITDYSTSSKKTWSILEYLITFRDREISSDELIDVFWQDERSSNPTGALKTLMFRVRQLLLPLDYPPHQLIVQHRKTYSWTRQLTTVTDVDQFESLCSRAESPGISEEHALSLYAKAIAFYKGDFLPQSGWESWVIPLCTYYHSLYQNAVHKILEILSRRQDYASMIDLCRRAVTIEAYDEDFHYYLVYALYRTGDQHGALEHYNRTIDSFYDEFAVTPSGRFKELYKLICDKKHGVVTDLSLIQEGFRGKRRDGAFCCEPSVFGDIYQLESRAIERTGDSIFLCLLTLSEKGGDLPSSAIRIKAMEDLGSAIRDSLRKGDVYSRYSISQYLILLPTASYENGEMILKRIVQNFKKTCSRRDLTVSYSLQAVLPET